VSDAAAAPPAAPAPAEGGLARLVGVFVSPVRTFASIARRPTWLLPFAIGVALAIPLTELIFSKTDMRAEITKSMSKSGRKVSEEQLDQMVERTRKMGPVFDAIALVFVAGATFGTAAVLWGACQAFGWGVRYRQSLGVTAHAFLPQTVASAGLLAVLWNRDTVDKATMGDALHTNLGFLADAHADPVGHALLSSVDAVSFWIMALLTLGLAAAAGASRKRVAILVVSLWVLFVLGKAGLAALFQ
jgi:hypothetical protein